MVEKFLKISDFIVYILENEDIFLEENFKDVKTKEEEMNLLTSFLLKFMLNT